MLNENPEFAPMVRKLLAGSVTLKEILTVAEKLPEAKKSKALKMIQILSQRE